VETFAKRAFNHDHDISCIQSTIAWEEQLHVISQPISIVLNRDMRRFNTYEIATRNASSIYEMHKFYNLMVFTILKRTNSCINTIILIYRLHLTIISEVLLVFIRIIRHKLKLRNLHYQNHVQAQVPKC